MIPPPKNQPSFGCAQPDPFFEGLAFGVGTTNPQITQAAPTSPSALERIFDARRNGPGVWKWRHYLQIYEKHFARFCGRATTVVEVGVFSGGSLEMWREYLGIKARIIGIDIEPSCRVYASRGFEIHIGDQSDRSFLRSLLSEIGAPDIFIDDGGHSTEQQRITCEEVLPNMAAGGVYICEDIFGTGNNFWAWLHGLSSSLNNNTGRTRSWKNPNAMATQPCQGCQTFVESVTFYPNVCVIELLASERKELVSCRRGSQWQPHISFLNPGHGAGDRSMGL
jgi:hypothetical protein